MRYFLGSNLKKPNGQIDEQISVSRRLKPKDIQLSSVILDFKDGKVLQASMNGVTVPRDFIKIRDFYHQHYKRLIEDLESVYGQYTAAQPEPDISLYKEPESN